MLISYKLVRKKIFLLWENWIKNYILFFNICTMFKMLCRRRIFPLFIYLWCCLFLIIIVCVCTSSFLSRNAIIKPPWMQETKDIWKVGYEIKFFFCVVYEGKVVLLHMRDVIIFSSVLREYFSIASFKIMSLSSS